MKTFAIGAALVLGLTSGASALTVTVDGPFNGTSATGYNAAKAAEAAFIAGFAPAQFNLTTETFEGFSITPQAGLTSIDTSVGTFTQIVKGQINAGLRILSGTTSPFDGRRDMTANTFVTENDSTGKWLDSNDSREVKWDLELAKASTAIGFFLTDVSDVGAKVTATFADGSGTQEFTITNPTLTNGRVVYVRAVFSSLISSVTFEVDKNNDGWGIDNITAVAPVPLPMGAWFALTGLAGAVALRRRKAQAA